jgi:hypothetical protein
LRPAIRGAPHENQANRTFLGLNTILGELIQSENILMAEPGELPGPF